MTIHTDHGPAAQRFARLAEGTPDDALGAPTPCASYTVGDLIDHVAGAAVAFRAAAVKQPLEGAAAGNAAHLAPDWRSTLPVDLEALAIAWRAPDAWDGMTRVGGIDLPGTVAGIVALEELLVHGWDLAVATGQDAGYDGPGLDAVHDAVSSFRANGIEGLFGPEVRVPGDAPLFDRILGLTGRDPAWRAPAPS